jgi:hypothetical protein
MNFKLLESSKNDCSTASVVSLKILMMSFAGFLSNISGTPIIYQGRGFTAPSAYTYCTTELQGTNTAVIYDPQGHMTEHSIHCRAY